MLRKCVRNWLAGWPLSRRVLENGWLAATLRFLTQKLVLYRVRPSRGKAKRPPFVASDFRIEAFAQAISRTLETARQKFGVHVTVECAQVGFRCYWYATGYGTERSRCEPTVSSAAVFTLYRY